MCVCVSHVENTYMCAYFEALTSHYRSVWTLLSKYSAGIITPPFACSYGILQVNAAEIVVSVCVCVWSVMCGLCVMMCGV